MYHRCIRKKCFKLAIVTSRSRGTGAQHKGLKVSDPALVPKAIPKSQFTDQGAFIATKKLKALTSR